MLLPLLILLLLLSLVIEKLRVETRGQKIVGKFVPDTRQRYVVATLHVSIREELAN